MSRMKTLFDDYDREMFEQLYMDNCQIAFYIAKRILHDETLAEDAVAEAFLRVGEVFPRIHNINSHKMQYYLVVTVKNTCFSMLKKLKDRPNIVSYEENAENHEMVSEAENIEYIFLKDCVSKLSETDKEILYLRTNLGLAFKEIAVALNVTQAAARQRFRYAKSKLKKLLLEEEPL